MVIGDGGDDAGRPLEVEYCVAQLGIQHIAVGDNHHAVEQLDIVGIVQVGEKVRRPGNRVGLA